MQTCQNINMYLYVYPNLFLTLVGKHKFQYTH